jgi:uncharacterized membrane protein
MNKNRMEAFSDGVLAVAITIMVLELKIPHGETLGVLWSMMPKFLSYVLSFIYVGIYWNNHHHMLQATQKTNGAILWANHHLLFWLTLIPFATGWMGENHFGAWPLIVYGFVLLMCSIAYFILQQTIIASEGSGSLLKRAVAMDWKGKLSPPAYILAMILACWMPWMSSLIYVAIALLWLVPDRRIEKVYNHKESSHV